MKLAKFIILLCAVTLLAGANAAFAANDDTVLIPGKPKPNGPKSEPDFLVCSIDSGCLLVSLDNPSSAAEVIFMDETTVISDEFISYVQNAVALPPSGTYHIVIIVDNCSVYECDLTL